MEKNDIYAIRCNKEVKKEFMALCKIGDVSPSEVLQTVMIEFNEMAKSVMAMEDVSELRTLLQSSINRANEGINELERNSDPGKYLP